MNTALYDERKTRIAKAVALETPDRVPVVLELAAFAARTQKISVSKFCASRLASSEAILKTVQDVGGADGVDYSNSFPSVLSMAWLSKVKLPGLELPDDELWQVVEAELMKREDYDRIIAEGWMNWFMSYITERIDPGLFPRLMAQSNMAPKLRQCGRRLPSRYLVLNLLLFLLKCFAVVGPFLSLSGIYSRYRTRCNPQWMLCYRI